jgi:hypothetical protein
MAELTQRVVAFNTQSNGALLLNAGGPIGDFVDQVMFSSLETTRRRDRSNNGDEAATEVGQINNTGISIAGSFGPFNWQAQDAMWQGMSESGIVNMLSTRTAEAIMKDQVNTVAAALVGAMPTAATHTATGVATFSELNGATAKLGDADGNLRCYLMSGAARRALIGDALSSSKELFDYQGVSVMNFDGKMFIAVDCPALTDGTDNYNILGLFAGAAVVSDQGNYASMIEKQGISITRNYQVDYSFTLSLRGHAYAGTANPTDVELATAGNWTNNTDGNIKAGLGCLLVAAQTAP